MPRGGSRTAGTSKKERFVIIVNGFQRSILNVAAVLDPPLNSNLSSICERYTLKVLMTSVIRKKDESKNGCYKKTKHAKFSEEET